MDLKLAIIRYDKSDLTRIIRIEILSELTLELIDLKFSQTENDPYRTELDPNIFYIINFLSKKNLLD